MQSGVMWHSVSITYLLSSPTLERNLGKLLASISSVIYFSLHYERVEFTYADLSLYLSHFNSQDTQVMLFLLLQFQSLKNPEEQDPPDLIRS